MSAHRTILLGKAEEIDLLPSLVRSLLDREGVYIGSDSRTPQVIVPLVSTGGKVFSMKVDAELEPSRFLPTLTLKGPYTPETPPPFQWLETRHFLPVFGEPVLMRWVRPSGNTYRVGCFLDDPPRRWVIAGTGKSPRENPHDFVPLAHLP